MQSILSIRTQINDRLRDVEPSKLLLYTVGGIVAFHGLVNVVVNREEIQRKVFSKVYKFIQDSTPIGKEVAKQKEDIVKHLVGELAVDDPEGVDSFKELPKKGLSKKEVLRQMEILAKRDTDKWSSRGVSGCVYLGDEEHTRFLSDAAALFALANPLHPDVFPSTRKFEAEVVSMGVSMMNGPAGACGAMTTGGTESILMAMKAYRDRAREERGVTAPELVVPITAHAAFDKAAQYFNIKIKHIEVDPKTQKVVVSKVRAAITSNTIALVGSAPDFAHGIIDPIEELSALALEHKIGLHVDCCLGGFILPWARRLGGYQIPAFDFEVPGVTSMSADTHKYAYTTKGTSLVLFRSKELRHYMYFCISTWPGGTYASPSLSGSRAGSLIAACYASLVHLGENGFMRLSEGTLRTAQAIVAGLRTMDGIEVIGAPPASVFSFRWRSDHDTFRLSSSLSKRGWSLSVIQDPVGIHFSLTAAHIGVDERFLADVQASVDECAADPELYKGGTAAIYGVTAALPGGVKDVLVTDLAFSYLDALMVVPDKNAEQEV